MTADEAAGVIERYLRNSSSYPQEWTDFAETEQADARVELFRKRCDELEPLVNRPGEMDEDAVAELKLIVQNLRSMI